MQDLAVLATGRQVRAGGDDGVGARHFTAITVEVSPEQAHESRRLQARLGLSGVVRPIDLASLAEGGERIDPERAPGGAAHQSVLITPQDARRFGAWRRTSSRRTSSASRAGAHR